MKIKPSKLTVITTLLTLLPMALGAVLYSRLPDMVVTHWGFDGQPNGWSSRAFACFGIPAIMAALGFIVGIAMDDTAALNGTSRKMAGIGRWVVPVLSLTLLPVMLIYPLGIELNIERVVCTILGVLFTVTGNYLPKCRRNSVVGIRLPWTLASDENWDKTHRLAGFVWMLCGILLLISTWAGTSLLSIAMIAVVAIVPAVCSYILHRRGI